MIANVVKIERAKCSSLSSILRVGPDAVSGSHAVAWQQVDCKVPAKLVHSSRMEAKNIIYTMNLSFKACKPLADIDKFAYRITLADGTVMLIGSAVRPFPVATMSRTYPDNMTDSQLTEYNVTYSSPKPLPVLLSLYL